ncbi:MAG: BolA family protein [Acetobacteraceae bacterium]
MESRADRIAALLKEAFAPSLLEVHDDSRQHVGHPGARPEGETHYSVRLVSAVFAGKGRLARSRAVHAALEREFGGGLHALSLTLRAPGESDG